MRVAIAVGVMPCSTSVTISALNSTDCCGLGSFPVISSQAMSPSETLPMISFTRSCPRTPIRSAVLQPISERIGLSCCMRVPPSRRLAALRA